MENETSLLQKIEFCKKHQIPFKEFWFHYDLFIFEEEEKRLKKRLGKAKAKKAFQDFLFKTCLKVA